MKKSMEGPSSSNLSNLLFFSDMNQVVVNNFIESMDKVMRPYLPHLIKQNATERKKVGVLISGSGTNLQALIDATTDPSKHIGAEIVLVISNKPHVEGLERARRANISTKVSMYETKNGLNQIVSYEVSN